MNTIQFDGFIFSIYSINQTTFQLKLSNEEFLRGLKIEILIYIFGESDFMISLMYFVYLN